MKKSPLAGMGFAQKIATIALAVLALIALVAVLAHGGGRGASGPISSSGNTSVGSGSTSGEHSGGTSTGASSGNGSGHSSATGTRRGGGQADGLATVSADELPSQATKTLDLIDAGGPFPYSRDGIVFSNREGVLPKHPRGWYHEYTVKTPGESDRGARRLVQGKDGTIYYSDDHYRSFRRVQR